MNVFIVSVVTAADAAAATGVVAMLIAAGFVAVSFVLAAAHVGGYTKGETVQKLLNDQGLVPRQAASDQRKSNPGPWCCWKVMNTYQAMLKTMIDASRHRDVCRSATTC